MKTPPVPAQPRTILTPEQFAALYECLPDAQSKLLVETAVESGLCWGELRVRDLDVATRMLTVSRAVVQVHPRVHPDNRQAEGAPHGARPGPRRSAVPGTRRGSAAGLRTTEKYLHTLPDAHETALDALAKSPQNITARSAREAVLCAAILPRHPICPARGRRVNGAPYRSRRTRSATADHWLTGLSHGSWRL